MKRRSIAIGLFGILSLSSCDKDGYPTKSDLVGTWVEDAPYNDTLTFRSNGSLIRVHDGVKDTLVYRANGKDGNVAFTNPSDASFGEEIYEVLGFSSEEILLVNYRTTSSQNADGHFKRQ